MGRLSSRDRPEQLQLADSFVPSDGSGAAWTEGPDNAISIGDFVERLGLRMTASRVESNPYMINGGGLANHWRCTFSMGGARPSMPVRFQTYFSTNGGRPEAPNVFEVLECLASDADVLESHPSFEDWSLWMSDVMDSGSPDRLAYERLAESTRRLNAFLGAENYRALMEVER